MDFICEIIFTGFVHLSLVKYVLFASTIWRFKPLADDSSYNTLTSQFDKYFNRVVFVSSHI